VQKAAPEARVEDEDGDMYDDVSAMKSVPTTATDDDNEILYEAEPMYHVRFFTFQLPVSLIFHKKNVYRVIPCQMNTFLGNFHYTILELGSYAKICLKTSLS